MQAETPPSPPEAAPCWPVLSLHERRVLGVLIEKAKTTPYIYPLSINALVTGCNQKSNRDPILNLTDREVEAALAALLAKGLVLKLTGGRGVDRWRHNLYDAWHVEKVELAVLAELLLCGPRTEGELRRRASRMEPIVDLGSLRAVLRPLAERRLVVYLTPEGRRGTLVTHGFHDPQDLERLRASCVTAALGSETAPAPSSSRKGRLSALETGLAEARAEVAALRDTVAELQVAVASLAQQVQAHQEARGVP